MATNADLRTPAASSVGTPVAVGNLENSEIKNETRTDPNIQRLSEPIVDSTGNSPTSQSADAPRRRYFIAGTFTCDPQVFADYVTKLDDGKGVLHRFASCYQAKITDAQAEDLRQKPWIEDVSLCEFFRGEPNEPDEDHHVDSAGLV